MSTGTEVLLIALSIATIVTVLYIGKKREDRRRSRMSPEEREQDLTWTDRW